MEGYSWNKIALGAGLGTIGVILSYVGIRLFGQQTIPASINRVPLFLLLGLGLAVSLAGLMVIRKAKIEP